MSNKYKVVKLSDSEYEELFDEKKDYQYSFRLYTDKLGGYKHEIYALKDGDKDIANMAIAFHSANDNSNDAVFIVGFQRNKALKEYKGRASFLLDYIINKFKKKHTILLYCEQPELASYYSEFGFIKCNDDVRKKLGKKYGFEYRSDLVMMVYKD